MTKIRVSACVLSLLGRIQKKLRLSRSPAEKDQNGNAVLVCALKAYLDSLEALEKQTLPVDPV